MTFIRAVDFLFSNQRKLVMKKLIGLFVLSTTFLLAANCNNKPHIPTMVSNEDSLNTELLKAKAIQAKGFCEKKKMNLSFCLLTNMKVHSGKVRFYVWDFEQDKAIDSGLVSHGCGNAPWGVSTTKEKATFSNLDGSHCSSLGKYKIGERGHSDWGINIKYLLYGLEGSNNNALKRYIVLHSWEKVTDQATYPEGTVESWGCPAVSNAFMKRLDERLKQEKKPVLLWMF